MRYMYLGGAAMAIMLTLGACSRASEPVHGTPELPVMIEAAEDARLAAVLVYAQWCGSCKRLDPKVDTVKASGTFQATSFVTLDYSAKDKAAFFSAADAAGVGEALRGHFSSGVRTGQLLLVDLDDQEIVGTVKADMEPPAIAKAIREAAAGA